MELSRAKLVGIVNVTPDSFSDGGCYLNKQAALSHIEQLIDDGADVIDLGAESTRPGATPLSSAEEWERISTIVDDAVRLANQNHVPISIDTRHADTAKRVLEKGVGWINDVSGCDNHEMLDLLKSYDCTIVVMHHLGIPAKKDVTIPEGEDVIEVVYQWADTKLRYLEMQGIDRRRIVIDPGVGFGKTAQQSLTVIRRIEALQDLDIPLYVGHSRKSFFKLLADDYEKERESLTLEFSLEMSSKGVDYLRVHDVRAHMEQFSNMF